MKQTKQYVKPDPGSPLLLNYEKLNKAHKEEILKVATAYMGKYEIVRCPDCEAGDAYDPKSDTCKACWFGVLDDISKETIETEGWNDER